MILNQERFKLAHFEGSLDFLLHLIQKEEVDIYQIAIQELIKQFILFKSEHTQLESSAEFIGYAAYLIWLKSKKLLPGEEKEEEDEVQDFHFEIIHHLADYCLFKQAAKELIIRQKQQQACYLRGIDHPPTWKKPLGIDHISLDELSQLFQQMMAKAPIIPLPIQEEEWRVADKMQIFRHQLKQESIIFFYPLFINRSREEIIVLFLAILELIKCGEVAIGKDTTSSELCMYAKKEIKES